MVTAKIWALMGAPTAKYKEIFEKEDIEEDNNEEEDIGCEYY